jgi:hypothetical protein
MGKNASSVSALSSAISSAMLSSDKEVTPEFLPAAFWSPLPVRLRLVGFRRSAKAVTLRFDRLGGLRSRTHHSQVGFWITVVQLAVFATATRSSAFRVLG